METDRALLLRSISQLQRMAVDLAASHRGAVSGAHGAAEVASELLAPEVAAVSGEGEEMEVEGALGAERHRALLLRNISQLQRMAVDLAASHRGAVSGAHGAAEVASELLAPEVAAVSGEGEEMEVEGALGAELLPEQPQRAKHALCAGGLHTRVCGRCEVMLTRGPRKGHPCGRKAPCRLPGHCRCEVMLTRGPRKGHPCGRKAPCRAHPAKV